MQNYKDKFIEKTQKYFNRGQRNNSLPAIVSQAKFWKLEENEALAEIKSLWGSDFKQTDENSFRNAWKKINVEKTIDDYSKKSSIEIFLENEKLEKNASNIQKEIENEVKFFDYLDKISLNEKIKSSIQKCKNYSKESDLFSKIYSENDLVFITDSLQNNSENCIKDILTFKNKKERLSKYTYYSINPLNDINLGRKDNNVKNFRYILLESDSLDKENQLKMLFDMIEHNIPIKMITYTGGKSFHALLKINGIKSVQEYKKYAEKILKIGDKLKVDLFDHACKNPARLSRVPWGSRRDNEYEMTTQPLIYLNDSESLLNDAYKTMAAWADEIIGNKPQENLEVVEDEIKNDRLLYFIKDEDIVDLWSDGEKIHTLMIANYGDEKYLIDKKWKNESHFYSFASDKIKEKHGLDFSTKELKTLKIDFKNEIKIPFIGKRPYSKDCVNTFIPGWLGEVLNDESIPSKLNEPLKKFLDNIFGDDYETKEWTLQWMREFMHSFSVITAPVFWEIQGTGKTMLAKCFANAIGDGFKTPPNMDNVQFNAWLNHTVIIFEECSSGSKKDGKALGDLLKDWITENSITIEEKGKDPRQVKSKHCFIFNANISNSLPPVFIENNDRRYTIIRNDSAINLRELWNDEDFQRWDSGEYQKILMKWIYNLPKNDQINVRTGLNNLYKEEIVQMSKSNIEVAIEEIAKSSEGFISNEEIIAKLKNEYGILSSGITIGRILTSLGFKSRVKSYRSSLGTSTTKRGYEF